MYFLCLHPDRLFAVVYMLLFIERYNEIVICELIKLIKDDCSYILAEYYISNKVSIY